MSEKQTHDDQDEAVEKTYCHPETGEEIPFVEYGGLAISGVAAQVVLETINEELSPNTDE